MKQQEAAGESRQTVMDAEAIQKIIPHRFPFLLVDRVIELVDGQRIVTIKNVTFNEPFFQGHFPGQPVMPGVLILEAMAQTGAILAKVSKEGVPKDKTIFLVGASDAKWKRKVVPGDTLQIAMRFIKKRGPLWLMDAEATVEGRLVSCATISAMEG